MNKITIKGVEVPLHFTYKVFRILSEMWNMNVSQVFKSIGEIEGREVDVFVDIIAALAAAQGTPVDKDDAGQWIMENMDKLADVGAAMQAAFPAPKEAQPGKPIPSIVPAGEA